jgi:PadR family transcriptional regulator, regulatory protein PadR
MNFHSTSMIAVRSLSLAVKLPNPLGASPSKNFAAKACSRTVLDPSKEAFNNKTPLRAAAFFIHVDNQHELIYRPVEHQQGRVSMITAPKAEVLQGTLDLLVLKTLDTLGPLHGFGIARRIQQVSNDTLLLNQGTLYPALVRLEQRGLIRSKWGVSENNRRARYYSLTKAGQKHLTVEAQNWERMASIITRVLAGAEEG